MKRTISIAILVFMSHMLWAQKADTTEIKLGKSKITIYDENARELDVLRKSQTEFKTKIQALRDSIHGIKEEMGGNQDSTLKYQLKNNIEELKKQIEAYSKGIDDMSSELDKLSNQSYKFEFNTDEDNPEIDKDKDDRNFDLDGKHGYRRKFKGHWTGFEIGMNNFTNASQKMELPVDGKFMELNTNKSWNFALNAVQFNIPLFTRYMGLVTGFGFEWNGYALKKNVKIQENSNGVIYGQDIQDTLFKKNKLNITYLRIPLIMEIQIPVTQKDRRIFIAAGIVGKLKLRAKYKQIYNVGGKEQKDRMVDDFQLNPLNYGLTARIGYRGIRLFANYSLTPLFDINQGPELYPFSVGLSILPF